MARPTRGQEKVASAITRLVIAGSAWSFIAFVLHLVVPRVVEWVDLFFYAFGISAGHTLFSAVHLAVVGAGLGLGRRFAMWWTVIAIEGLSILQATGLLVIDWTAPSWRPHVYRIDDETLQTESVIQVLLCTVVVVGLLWARNCFPARIPPGSRRLAVGVLIGGVALSAMVAYALTQVFDSNLTGQHEKLAWSLRAALGRSNWWLESGHHGHYGISLIAGTISTAALLTAIGVLMRSIDRSRKPTAAEALAIQKLLLIHGDDDSLGYFATRHDKSYVFSPDRQAAIAYRVVAGVSLASGSPIGDPAMWPAAIAAWKEQARSFGWSAAVLGATEAGAHAYVAAGLRALTIGDEAVLETRDFRLNAPGMAPVRQSAHRVERAGYTATIVRHDELSDAQMHEVLLKADEWRVGGTERGFSMALSRLGDPTDGRCVMVLAHDGDGTLRGLLSLVPWGLRGASLDLMRRDPASVNGLMEFMVAKLMSEGPEVGITKVSLNFAVFREVFADAEKVGAGPFTRITAGVLAFFSRYFQIQSLYESNAKYMPSWSPRLVCMSRSGSLARVLLAVGMAEGFVPNLHHRGRLETADSTVPAGLPGSPEYAEAVTELRRSAAKVALPARRLNQQQRTRHDKVTTLRDAGIDPYPVAVPRTTTAGTLRADSAHGAQSASLTGRVTAIRKHGGLTFADLSDIDAHLQVMLDRSVCGSDHLSAFNRLVDIGDLVAVTGTTTHTRTGEFTLDVSAWTMASKCLRPLPGRGGLTDPETRVRHRTLDLIANPSGRDILHRRSVIVAGMRAYFTGHGYVEVETPVLQPVHGGANARPFETHINAYDTDLFLRIAPELYLKRLTVAGMGPIFEVSRNFRNEGVDATHNPEFTSVEAYRPWADYLEMADFTEGLIKACARAAYGREVVRHPQTGAEVDISGSWRRTTVYDAVSQAAGVELTPDTDPERVLELCKRHGVRLPAGMAPDTGRLVTELYEELVEDATVEPTFYLDFPVETSPLTRPHRNDPRLAERWDLVCFGMEIGTAYSELIDPIEQRRRLTEQSLQAAAGDPEAMSLDEDFLDALEYAMPPTGGLGIGVDRLVMLITGESIRPTLTFPFVRPQRS